MHPGIVESKKAQRGTQSRRCLGPGAAQVQKKRRDHVVCGKGEFLLFASSGASSAVGERLERQRNAVKQHHLTFF